MYFQFHPVRSLSFGRRTGLTEAFFYRKSQIFTTITSSFLEKRNNIDISKITVLSYFQTKIFIQKENAKNARRFRITPLLARLLVLYLQH